MEIKDIEILIRYAHKYDDINGKYNQYKWSGESVIDGIIGLMVDDGLISNQDSARLRAGAMSGVYL